MPDLLKPNEKQAQKIRKFDPSIYQPSESSGAAPRTSTRRGSRLLLWSSVSLVVVIIMIGAVFMTRVIAAVNSTNTETGEKVGLFDQIRHLISNPEQQLNGEADDRINILLAGIGGAGHQGAYLADTIILMSIKPSTNDIAMMSIPRDLYVEIPDYGFRKINNALAFGVQSDYPGGGEALLAQVVSDTFDVPVHYFARIDFEGFRKAIDNLGGIDVTIDAAFTDYEYPDYNYGYQVISFKKGIEHMTGERALQFVRSRHGNNGEGSDFARSQRQQKVLFALKNQFFSVNNLINPSSVVSALESLGQHNQTNMEIWEIVRLAKMSEPVQKSDIITITLDTSEEGYLYSDHTLDGAYILRPTAGDFTEIQLRLATIFDTSNISREHARIEVQNGTTTEGLATQTADLLRQEHFNVVQVGNVDSENEVSTTTIYDLSNGTKPYTLASLKNLLNARIAPATPAAATNTGIPTAVDDSADILIIIGADYIQPSQLTQATN
ncbi:MAG: LCP family protein [Patescibacteria group bacterium]